MDEVKDRDDVDGCAASSDDKQVNSLQQNVAVESVVERREGGPANK